MLVCNYFFSLFFSDSFFMGLVVGLMGRFLGLWVFWSGWFYFGRGGFVYIGVALFYIGAVLFTSGWFYFHRGVKMVICGIFMMLFYNKLRS